VCDQIKTTFSDIGTAMHAWQLNPWRNSSGSPVTIPQSVSLSTTREFYMTNVNAKFGTITRAAAASCGLEPQWITTNASNTDWLARLAGNHQYSLDAVLQPLNDYTIHLREMTNDGDHPPTLTSACLDSNHAANECQIQYKPQSTLLTTSGGYLLSELQSRSYQRQNIPNSTDAVIIANGTGAVSSLLTALVNVKLPCPGNRFFKALSIGCLTDNDDQFGWAFSAGPALRLSGDNTVSRVGLFGGVSLHLWRYLYATPGFHVGEFADFPAGFTAPGQVVPASFTGNLTPVSRTSVRFAVAVTYKGFNLPGGSGKSQGGATTQNNSK
jgi:hypothetical protein